MSEPSIEVRLLNADDWQLWRDLRLRSLADAPDAFGSTLTREQAFTEEAWRERMRSSPVIAFVDGVPAAMGGGYLMAEGLVHIIAMWTAPEFRRRGLSKLVLDQLVRIARKQGHRVALDVTRDNGAARAAYEHYGFVATGRVEPLREGSDLLVDEMVLPE